MKTCVYQVILTELPSRSRILESFLELTKLKKQFWKFPGKDRAKALFRKQADSGMQAY